MQNGRVIKSFCVRRADLKKVGTQTKVRTEEIVSIKGNKDRTLATTSTFISLQIKHLTLITALIVFSGFRCRKKGGHGLI